MRGNGVFTKFYMIFFISIMILSDFTLIFPIFDKHQWNSPINIELLCKPNESLVGLFDAQNTNKKWKKFFTPPPHFLRERKRRPIFKKVMLIKKMSVL